MLAKPFKIHEKRGCGLIFEAENGGLGNVALEWT
jgi:hypothetical protein